MSRFRNAIYHTQECNVMLRNANCHAQECNLSHLGMQLKAKICVHLHKFIVSSTVVALAVS